jgi:hypothetical protein
MEEGVHGECLIMATLKVANILLQYDRQTEFSRLPVGSEFLPHTSMQSQVR